MEMLDPALDPALVVVGAFLVTATLVDIVVTVIGVSGGHGMVSKWVSRTVWRLARSVAKGGHKHDVLRAAGPAIFIGITMAWAVLLVVGWVLVFWPDAALSPSEDAGLIGLWDRFDHSASLVLGGSTPLATSDEQPWAFVARLARFSGLGLASFGLAYALPVVGAVVRIRRAATGIDVVGGDDRHIETTARLDGGDSVAHLYLINVTGDLCDAGQLTNAYPILPFFHSKQPSTSLPVQVARLDAYLARRDPSSSSVPDSVTEPLARAIDSLLEVVGAHFLAGDPGFPADPDERRSAIIAAWCEHDGWAAHEIPSGRSLQRAS